MKNTLVKVGVASYLGLVVLALAMTTTTSFAQENPGAILKAIEDFNKDFQTFANKIVNISPTYSKSLDNELTLTQTSNGLGPDIRNSSNTSSNNILASSVLYVPSAAKASLEFAKLMPNSEDRAKKQASLFNAGNYLNTYVLTTTPEDRLNFINTLSNAGNPIQALPSTIYKNLADNPSASTFLSGMASFSARESVAISALIQLINERTVAESGGQNFTIDGKAASALAYDEAITSQRMKANWYKNFLSNPNTTSTDLQRENVLIAAESLHEQFEIRMQLEQINATLATLLLSYEEGTNKPLLLNARNAAVAESLQR